MSKGYGHYRNWMYAKYDLLGNVIHETYVSNLSYLGEWETGKNWLVNDFISYNGKTYKVVKEINNSIVSPDKDTMHFEQMPIKSIPFVAVAEDSQSLTEMQMSFINDSKNTALVIGDRVYNQAGTDLSGTHFVSFETIDNTDYILYADVLANGTLTKRSKEIVDSADVSALQQAIENIKDGTTHLFENITDKNGNKRFVEGDITMNAITGVTQTYGKWSLSGSHLMIVLCIKTEANITLAYPTKFADIILPNYITDKLVSIQGTAVDVKNITFVKSTGSISSTPCRLEKITNGVSITKSGSYITELNDVCRIQFDLLIDDEYE